MEIENKYGLLLTPDIKLHRMYFKEMVKLHGINVLYRSLKPGRKWTNYGELEGNYNTPELIGCIFNEHPDQQTLKKIGWVSELQSSSSLIHVPYDTEGLQVGCLFIVPSGLDDGKGRLFRCVSMSNIMVYPASITCEIVPEYENTFDDASTDYRDSSFNFLNKEEGYD